MDSEDVLERAITKAIDGGWVYHGLTDEGKIHYTDTGIVVDWLRGGRNAYSAETIIFNHDFAKALWGESDNENPNLVSYPATRAWEEPETIAYWQYHLQKMVVSDDPIKYLGENI